MSILWLSKGQWNRFFSQHFSFPLSLSAHQRATLIFIYMLLLPEGQMSESRLSAKHNVISAIGEHWIDREFHLFLYWKGYMEAKPFALLFRKLFQFRTLLSSVDVRIPEWCQAQEQCADFPHVMLKDEWMTLYGLKLSACSLSRVCREIAEFNALWNCILKN